ncbi:putative cytochrome b5 [Lachnellula hyalina]|uniref:Putative cytochrome b5 n=1 Tax=Lachnellula hyalina TaxID=1316788 RepID=A0A8H8TZ20_9HELO|nr:putative cytochrome b5 [Lachnellula hyalina]TVY27267.1 putative cytochrome b5 [Lachnellula hyalina]
MGWLKIGTRKAPLLQTEFIQDLKASTQHIETLSLTPRYPSATTDTKDKDLPFIPATEVSQRISAGAGGLRMFPAPRIVIVVDNIVYDCTDFISEHPGGEQVIKSFAGGECSWQFWRFHGKQDMEEFGKPLRVGRTEGLKNRFQEPNRYVGLRRWGNDVWD